jgi:hypothetical protein
MKIARTFGSVVAMLVLPSAVVYLALRPVLVFARDSGWPVDLTRTFFAGVALVGLAIVYVKSRQKGMSVVRTIVEVTVTLITSIALSFVVLLAPFFL